MLETINSIITTLKKNLIWIVALSAIAGGISYFLKNQVKPLYKSYSKIFPMTAGDNDPLSGMKASFGIQSDGNLSKYYNVNELVNSRNISRQIVSYPTNTKAQKNLFDWIIADYNKQQYWTKDKIKTNVDSLERIIIASDLLKSFTFIKVEKSEFTTIECTTADKDLSLRLNECVLQCLSDFYINSKTEKARTDLMRIGYLKDSLKGSLDYLERAMAGFTDNSQYTIKETANLPQKKLIRLHEEIGEQYATTAVAYQNANFKLLSESPIFQILDKPIGPVQTIKPSPKNSFISTFVISCILLSLVALHKIFFNLIKRELLKA